MYDDRIQLLSTIYPDKLYPNIDLIRIYENNRYFRDWLIIHQLPHPKTWIYYSKEEAIQFVDKCANFPIVSKLNIGASGKGVTILESKESVFKEIYLQFGEGKRIIGIPNIRKGSILKKLNKLVQNPGFIKSRLKEYKQQSEEVHKNYIILQEFIKHTFEWRCVIIGNSYFAHKKLVKAGKASGSLLKEYGNPPPTLLNFVREISIKHKIDSAAIDIFEHNGTYLINEIQCFFGQSDSHQMYVENLPGRYYFENEKWIFEEGEFNDNKCFDLRLTHAIHLCTNKNKVEFVK